MSEMVQRIVNSEARRNARGELVVYALRPEDGGGRYEVAGINERYHSEKAAELKALIEAGHPIQAEREAVRYIKEYTNTSGAISENPGLSYNLRDCAWNRGPTGAIKILQGALEVATDGHFGPISQAALTQASRDFTALLQSIRTSRENYERTRGRDESSIFWNGLKKRWNRVLTEGISYNDGTIELVPVM
ncbi:lysozyme family protein [Shimia marina]|uniref:Uncharacterized protein n=1 Tax=Shimia marina TaxID=321267 RepID=A0A0P1ENM3_9RHOB|nr:hypothetical protein [Shimia marina]CUH51898.1 hypothetical protein SHM7688_01337 [Shimia marina]SFE46321.1 hypothetical protein SAMN04488037_109142 [Shimia marina]